MKNNETNDDIELLNIPNTAVAELTIDSLLESVAGGMPPVTCLYTSCGHPD